MTTNTTINYIRQSRKRITVILNIPMRNIEKRRPLYTLVMQHSYSISVSYDNVSFSLRCQSMWR